MDGAMIEGIGIQASRKVDASGQGNVIMVNSRTNCTNPWTIDASDRTCLSFYATRADVDNVDLWKDKMKVEASSTTGCKD